MEDCRRKTEESWAHSRVLIVLNVIVTYVSDKKEKKSRRGIRNFYRMIVDYSCV